MSTMTLHDRIALVARVLAGRRAEFARGGGGAKGAKAGKAGKSGKKAKGVATAGKGGACCKGEGGKFAPGNNYGSLNRSSAKVAANKAGRVAAKAVKAAEGPARAGIAGMVGRSKQAAAAAGRVKAARDREAVVQAQKAARNAKARERRAAKKAEVKPGAAKAPVPSRATPERDARAAALKGADRATRREELALTKARAEVKRAGGGVAGAKARSKLAALGKSIYEARGRDAIKRMVEKSRTASDKAGAAQAAKPGTALAVKPAVQKAEGRGTPERARKAEWKRVERAKKRISALDAKIAKAQAALTRPTSEKGFDRWVDRVSPNLPAAASGRERVAAQLKPKPTSTKADRAAAMKRMVEKSRATTTEVRAASVMAKVRADEASGKAKRTDAAEDAKLKRFYAREAASTGPVTPANIQARLAAARAAQKADIARTMAARPQIPSTPGAKPPKAVADKGARTVSERELKARQAGASGPQTLAARGPSKAAALVRERVAREESAPKATGPAVASSLKSLRERTLREDVSPAVVRRELDTLKALPVRELKHVEKELLGVNVGKTKGEIVAHIEKSIERSQNAGDHIRGLKQSFETPLPSIVTTPVTRGIGGRPPDLRNVAPAGPTSAAARLAEARGKTRDRMVRASREAAQGARMVFLKRKKQGRPRA